LPLAKRIIDLDPLNPMVCSFSSIIQFYLGQFQKAAEGWELLPKGIPQDNAMYRFFASYIFVYAGRTEEAMNLLEAVEQTGPSNLYVQFALFLRSVLREESHCIPQILNDEFLATTKRDAIISIYVTTLYAMLGDSDQALNWLEHAVGRGFINYPYLNDYDPFLVKLRGNSRFEQLMQRVKREWEKFEV
jgi:non-specific serine/threonine protein kinase